MTSNQRRPGFRLPWSLEDEAAAAEASQAAGGDEVSSAPEAAGPSEESELEAPAAATATASPDAAAAPEAARAPAPEQAATPSGQRPVALADAPAAETSAGFMRDLVAAMRRVAGETRQSGLSDLRAKSEEQVRTLEADSERRREELRAGAESDIAGVGEWARTEHERITAEAEQRVVGRRAQLDQQLAAETSRAEAAAQALRDRVAEYERELDAYHAQLSDIADPAAFASAAKRMPPPPRLGNEPAPEAPPAATPAPEVKSPSEAEPSPAESEAPSTRPAEPDARLDAQPAPAEATARGADAPKGEVVATEVLVKGLGSFGAITSFRQSLASVDGIGGVSLSLGPTGEFVFRAIHPVGFDVAAAIVALEGDAAKVEQRPEGGLYVTLDRAR